MRFNTKAKSEAELKAMKIWPKGVYQFKITDIVVTDRNGNRLMGGKNKAFPKIQLVMRIWDEQDRSRIIYDDIIDADDFAWKQRALFHAVDLGKQYDSDTHDTDMLFDRTGYLTLGINPANGDYEERNAVKGYIIPDDSIGEQAVSIDEFNDDIPTF